MKYKFFIILLFINLVPAATRADAQVVDFLRNTGKIYSVFAVVFILFIGIVFYLMNLDKRIRKIEKNNKDGY